MAIHQVIVGKFHSGPGMHDMSSARVLLGYTYKKETLSLAREFSLLLLFLH